MVRVCLDGSEIHLRGDEQAPHLQAVPTTGAGLEEEWAQQRFREKELEDVRRSSSVVHGSSSGGYGLQAASWKIS